MTVRKAAVKVAEVKGFAGYVAEGLVVLQGRRRPDVALVELTGDMLQAIGRGESVITAGMGEAVARAAANVEGQAAKLATAGGATDVPKPLPNYAAVKAGAYKGRAKGDRKIKPFDTEWATATIAAWLADDANRGRGGKHSVTAAAAANERDRPAGTRWSWGDWQILWGEATGDLAVMGRGLAYVAGIGYGPAKSEGGEADQAGYEARLTAWAGQLPKAAPASHRKAAAALVASFEAKAARRVDAEAAVKAKAAAAVKAKTSKAKGTKTTTTTKAAPKATKANKRCAGSGTMPSRIVSGKAEGECGTCGQLVRTRKGVTVGHDAAKRATTRKAA